MILDYTPFVAFFGSAVFFGCCLGLLILWLRNI